MFGYSLIRTKKLMVIYDKIAIFAYCKIRQTKSFNMTITGTITAVLPETGGVSKSGKQWRKKEAVVEYQHGQYPKSIVFQMMNDNIDKLNIQQGQEYDLEIDFEAREWNGRYFLQASCWKATPKSQSAQPQSATPTLDSMGVTGYQGQHAASAAPAGGDDLPF